MGEASPRWNMTGLREQQVRELLLQFLVQVFRIR